MVRGLAALAKTQGHASCVDLASDSMRSLKQKVQEAWLDYVTEFPSEQVLQDVPCATLGTQAESGAWYATEIRATSQIESEHEHRLRLAAWGQVCETAVGEAVEEYINATVVLTHCDYETAPIEQRLRRTSPSCRRQAARCSLMRACAESWWAAERLSGMRAVSSRARRPS